MTCADCGVPTAIISRHSGLFGKGDPYRRSCRPCLPAHADAAGYTEAEALYDACVDAVQRGQARRAARPCGDRGENRQRRACGPGTRRASGQGDKIVGARL